MNSIKKNNDNINKADIIADKRKKKFGGDVSWPVIFLSVTTALCIERQNYNVKNNIKYKIKIKKKIKLKIHKTMQHNQPLTCLEKILENRQIEKK